MLGVERGTILKISAALILLLCSYVYLFRDTRLPDDISIVREATRVAQEQRNLGQLVNPCNDNYLSPAAQNTCNKVAKSIVGIALDDTDFHGSPNCTATVVENTDKVSILHSADHCTSTSYNNEPPVLYVQTGKETSMKPTSIIALQHGFDHDDEILFAISPPLDLPPLPIASNSNLLDGTEVLVMGFPKPLQTDHGIAVWPVGGTLNNEIFGVLAIPLVQHSRTVYIRKDRAITGAMSGGPTTNINGELLAALTNGRNSQFNNNKIGISGEPSSIKSMLSSIKTKLSIYK